MPLLPKPYPDEVVGSIVARGCRHAGIPLKRMLKFIYGTPRSYVSLLMTLQPGRVGRLAGLDAEELLVRHTVFPYATAFLPQAERARLLTKALTLDRDESLSSITKNVSHSASFLRVCPVCLREDVANFGEAYWHRSHLLPGVEICPSHDRRLINTNEPLRARAQSGRVALPTDILDRRSSRPASQAIANAIAAISIDALNGNLASLDLPRFYQQQAISLGYELPGGGIAGKALAEDLGALIPKRLLRELGGLWATSDKNPWPARLVRAASSKDIASPKHVLMLAFLSCSWPRDTPAIAAYPPPGKPRRDYAELDARVARSVAAAILRAKAQNERRGVRELLQQAGVWSSFRHHRDRFPETAALMQGLRHSDQAMRQLGRREYWRKGLGLTTSSG